MAKKAEKGINPELEKAISKLLKETMDDKDASITDKVKIIDRSLKLEAIKLKLSDDSWGRGLFDQDEEEEK